MATRLDIETHYDAHDEIFLRILDQTYLAYSTGHWDDTDDMEAAQTAKFDYIARQVNLGGCRNVLEIGSGWGSFAKYCHRHYPDLRVVGLTLSSTQKQFVDAQGWPNFQCVLSDWREFVPNAKFDAVVAIESFEHYASMEDRRQNRHVEVYRRFFESCRQFIAEGAALYVQSSIVRAEPDDIQGFKDARYILEKVFPGSALATISSIQLGACPHFEFEALRLCGGDMIKTLEVWKRSLLAQGETIDRDFGPAAFKFFETYFDASIRRFARGHVDLLELTLRGTRLI